MWPWLPRASKKSQPVFISLPTRSSRPASACPSPWPYPTASGRRCPGTRVRHALKGSRSPVATRTSPRLIHYPCPGILQRETRSAGRTARPCPPVAQASALVFGGMCAARPTACSGLCGGNPSALHGQSHFTAACCWLRRRRGMASSRHRAGVTLRKVLISTR